MFDLFGVAVAGGMFVVPLYAFLTTTVHKSETARTVALLWVEDSDVDRVKLMEVASDADDITESPRLPTAGVLGARTCRR